MVVERLHLPYIGDEDFRAKTLMDSLNQASFEIKHRPMDHPFTCWSSNRGNMDRDSKLSKSPEYSSTSTAKSFRMVPDQL